MEISVPSTLEPVRLPDAAEKVVGVVRLLRRGAGGGEGWEDPVYCGGSSDDSGGIGGLGGIAKPVRPRASRGSAAGSMGRS